ncbi:uncharacterized protein LOC110026924 [Phalaenopsis equestris]|uniref:uncharacterized protein LOC110026924 n=1 Tax=Phalaenopsis equestris TaxID=78828 RepID=UPI0009E64315|nr:uncharacterized protein LOC110026924 [Phalaenopsis equestris]
MNSKSNLSLSFLTNHPTQTLPPLPPSSDGRPPSRRRTNSRTPSFSSSTSSFSSSPSSFSTSSSPSPFHSLLPSSSIPFSWERQPGIPKYISAAAAASGGGDERNLLLPLPPPLRSVSRIAQKKRFNAAVDPFTAALVECAKESSDADAIWWRRSDGSGGAVDKMVGICRRTVMADRAGFQDLFGSFSCKTSCSVSDATTIAVPRSRVRSAGAYGLLDRRSE